MLDRQARPARATDRPRTCSASSLCRRIADEVGGALSVEYWKSAPYFLNFMDGYQLSEKFRQHELGPVEPQGASRRRSGHSTLTTFSGIE